MDDIKLEILKASHLEHFKYSEELARILPFGHPKTKKMVDKANELAEEMRKLTNNDKNEN